MTTKNAFGYLVPAKAGSRTVAFCIDTGINFVLLFIIWKLLGDWILENIFNWQELGFENIIQLAFFFLFMYATISFIYYFFLETIRGQTIGKMFMDIITVEVGGTKKIGTAKAAGRALYKCVLSGIGVMQIIDFAMVYSDDRSLGDKIFKTCVITGDSWRQHTYQKNQAQKEHENASTFGKCSCGFDNVPLYGDGTGICPKCKKVFSGK